MLYLRKQILFNEELLFKSAVIGIAVTIPFWMILNNISVILAVIISLWLISKQKVKYVFRNISLLGYLFIILYFLYAISILYSDDKKYAFAVLSRTILFVLIPIIFASGKNYISEKLKIKILYYFIIACFLSSIICFVNSLYSTYEYASVNPFNKSNGNFFSYLNLTSIIKIHPIYFGVQILMCLSILSYDLVRKQEKIPISLTKKLFLIGYFLILIFLLNSFVLIISLGFLFLYIVYIIYKNCLTNNIKWLLVFACLMSVPLYFSSYFISEKFKGIDLKNDFTTRDYSGNEFTAIKARNAKTYCSIDLIQDNFIFGVGIGDGNSKLFEYYLKNNFKHGYVRKYNSHNQLLTTFIYTGIFGFLILVLIFFILYRQALKYHQFYLTSFLLIISPFFITESVLERHNGIVFFVYFSILLSVKKENNFESI